MNAPIPVLPLAGESLPSAVAEVANVIATAMELAPKDAMYNAEVWGAAVESLRPNHFAALLMVPTLLFITMGFNPEAIRQFGEDFAHDDGGPVLDDDGQADAADPVGDALTNTP